MAAGLVLGLGNACYDTILEVDHLPGPGEKAERRGLHFSPGGQVASALVGCTRLGLQTSLLMRTGDDEAGERIRAALASEGVGLEHARTVCGTASASAVIVRDRGGERQIVWDTPQGLALEPEAVTPELFTGVAAVLFDGRDRDACLRAAQLARQRGIPVVADLDCPYRHTPELLPWVDHLIVPSSFTLPEQLRSGVVVVTLGSAGSRGWEPGSGAGQASEAVHVPAFAVAAIDTTGAGDAYHAGYIFALLQGWPLARRMRFASATAALSCLAVGSQAGLPDRAAVEALLASNNRS